jgi:hypothetical protein
MMRAFHGLHSSLCDHRFMLSAAPATARTTTAQDSGRRVDAVQQRLQLHLAKDCADADPVIVIGALGYELLRRVQLLEDWTPAMLDRFLIDFTRVMRRRVLDDE